MTLSTTINRVAYAGDGTTTAFAIPFPFIANTHVQVVLRSAAGVETMWVENTHYTLTGAGNPAGGTLTAATSPVDYTPAAGETLTLRRVAPLTQETDYPEGGAFPASAHEDALDKLTMVAQQVNEELSRCLHYPVSDTAGLPATLPGAAARANMYLGFGPDGAPLAVLPETAFPAAWGNTRLAKSAAYTVANADHTRTIALGGASFYTLTFDAAAGYADQFCVAVVNEDAGRGKRIALSGGDSFLLWPGQAVVVFNQNGAWRTVGRSRWKLSSAPVFYVNASSGSDTNDGLAAGAGAFATVQGAVNAVRNNLDFNGYVPVIQLTSGQTIAEEVAIAAHPVGNHLITIQGADGSNPNDAANFTWALSGTGKTAIFATDGAIINVYGIKFTAAAGSCTFLKASQFAVIDFKGCDFGTNAGGADLYVTGDGLAKMNMTGACNLSGGCGIFVNVHGNGVINLAAALHVTAGSLSLGTALLQAQNGGNIWTNGTAWPIDGIGAGTLAGRAMYARDGGIIDPASTSFPAGLTTANIMDRGGRIVSIVPPAFAAIATGAQSNVTGDDTTYEIGFGAESFDDNSNHSSGTFTAPLARRYVVGGSLQINGLDSAHTLGQIDLYVGSIQYPVWYGNPYARSAGGTMQVTFHRVLGLNKGDTVKMRVRVNGGTKTVDIDANNTWFEAVVASGN